MSLLKSKMVYIFCTYIQKEFASIKELIKHIYCWQAKRNFCQLFIKWFAIWI